MTRVANAPVGPRFYQVSGVSNTDPSLVFALDPSTKTVVGTPVTIGPRGFYASPNPGGTLLYVANGEGGSVSVIDLAAAAVTTTISLGDNAYGVAVSPTAPKAYAGLYQTLQAGVISTTTNQLTTTTIAVGNNPLAVAFTPNGTRAYVSSAALDTVTVIDATNDTVAGTISVGSLPSALAITPDGSEVYVSNALSGEVSVISTSGFTVTATIPVGGGARGVAFNADGSTAYVVVAQSSQGPVIRVIDTASRTITRTIPVGAGPVDVVAVDGDTLYVTVSGEDAVWAVNLA